MIPEELTGPTPSRPSPRLIGLRISARKTPKKTGMKKLCPTISPPTARKMKIPMMAQWVAAVGDDKSELVFTVMISSPRVVCRSRGRTRPQGSGHKRGELNIGSLTGNERLQSTSNPLE